MEHNLALPTITSVRNPRIKEAARLRRGRHRRRQRRTLIDGLREVARAWEAGVRLVEVFVCRPLCEGSQLDQLLERLAAGGSRIWEVTEEVFRKLAFGQRAEGIVAVAETPSAELRGLVLGENPLVAVLEGVEKPGNLGAVLRSADAAGVSAVVVADGGTDLYNPNAIRASLGTIFAVPVAAAPAATVLDWLRQRGLAIYAARVDAAIPYTDADYRGPAAIVLGSEARGLGPTWSAEDIIGVRIPMLGVADSLNVSVSAAIVFYEALRQRGERSKRSSQRNGPEPV